MRFPESIRSGITPSPNRHADKPGQEKVKGPSSYPARPEGGGQLQARTGLPRLSYLNKVMCPCFFSAKVKRQGNRRPTPEEDG